MTQLLDKARAIEDETVAIRREIHKQPEPGFREVATSSLVERELSKIGSFRIRRAAGTGIVADIGRGPAILLRADMDALEIQEETGLPYASQVPGMMHACGHDAHTAILLSAARLIAAESPALDHSIRLIFQPCEETSPGGALSMIRENVLDGVEAAVALHVYPQESVGTIALKSGPMMANSDDFDIIFHGRSGHAASPHLTQDSVVAAAEFVSRVQKIVSRFTDPFDNVVISIGRISSGTRRNVIAGHALIEGTARTLTQRQRERVRAMIDRAAASVAAEMEMGYEMRYIEGYPVLENHAGMVDHVSRTAERVLDSRNVRTMDHPSMGGEDFTYFAQRVPSCFFRLGSGGDDASTRFSHHNSRFNIDERCLSVGAALMAQSALDWRPAKAA